MYLLNILGSIRAVASSVYSNDFSQYGVQHVIQRSDHFFQSSLEKYPYIQLILEQSVSISGITVTHTACCVNRFRNVRIRIGDTDVGYNAIGRIITENTECTYFEGPRTDKSDQELRCSKVITGRYITIQLEVEGHLHIGEVKVILSHVGTPIIPEIVTTTTTQPPPVAVSKLFINHYIQCENSEVRIDCGNNGKVEIKSAIYGRTNNDICSIGSIFDDNCKKNVISILGQRYI